ncbi:MAG: hypothetical protein AMK70_00525 [Nitrospira bacterium SG8_35_1]|nr:MAG: hypothetical protein AMK70_00525 [Nitrospira bacterium SG8_35_1]
MSQTEDFDMTGIFIYRSITEAMMNKSRRDKLAMLILALVVLTMIPRVSGAWFSDPAINTRISPSTSNQVNPVSISDGSGGALIVWSEDVNGDFNIYAHRLDVSGDPVWTAPIVICSAQNSQDSPRIISDNTGGAIIVWEDSRNGPNTKDIYAQRINIGGQALWAANGIPVSPVPELQDNVQIVTDKLGGAIIAWEDIRSSYPQVYAQRIDSNGQAMWEQDGKLIALINYGQSNPDMIADGFGGAIVVWTDYRPLNISNIYAQKLDADGTRAWGDEGRPLCTKVGNQISPHVASDGFGGAIFSWADGRLGDETMDIYAQRLDSLGNVMWTTNGIPLTSAPAIQEENAIVSDGVGGAIVVWSDTRKENGDIDLYTQRVNASGVTLWMTDGAPVAVTDEFQMHPALISDGLGGVFITWQDFYRGGTSWNIYAQHMDSSGQPKWEPNGIAISIPDDTQSDPIIIPDASGGAIIAWNDGRAGTYTNVFAQQVSSATDGTPKTSFTTDELILFTSSWTMPAPMTTGTYDAGAIIIINSNTDYRFGVINYEVQ